MVALRLRTAVTPERSVDNLVIKCRHGRGDIVFHLHLLRQLELLVPDQDGSRTFQFPCHFGGVEPLSLDLRFDALVSDMFFPLMRAV
jgi:hypothetical protein